MGVSTPKILMKNLFCLLFVVALPLALASETQHRFKICVDVGGEDETVNGLITSHLKREFRALGDVDIVEFDAAWEYLMGVTYTAIKAKTGEKTGWLCLTSHFAKRVPKTYFKNVYKVIAIYPGRLGASYWERDNLQEWCILKVGSVNDDHLELAR